MSSNPLGPLIVLSGPSGSGKTTIVERFLANTLLRVRRAVTATTRSPRPGEVAGIDYHFWTVPEFEKRIQDQQMLEYAQVHGQNYYGTPLSEVTEYRQRGIGVILIIDVQGAEQIRQLYPQDHVSIFIVPPPTEVLRIRLQNRGEAPENIARRLQTAEQELLELTKFQYHIQNDDLDHAVNQLETTLTPYCQLRK